MHNERYLLFSARGLACFRRDIVAMLGVTTFALSPRLLLEDDDVQCCTESFGQNTTMSSAAQTVSVRTRRCPVLHRKFQSEHDDVQCCTESFSQNTMMSSAAQKVSVRTRSNGIHTPHYLDLIFLQVQNNCSLAASKTRTFVSISVKNGMVKAN